MFFFSFLFDKSLTQTFQTHSFCFAQVENIALPSPEDSSFKTDLAYFWVSLLWGGRLTTLHPSSFMSVIHQLRLMSDPCKS